MAEFNEVYKHAIYYDIVFNRDVSHEVDFIIDVYRHYHNGQSPSSLLDLACGPAYHARNFASRQLRAVGLDLREEMLAFADEMARREHLHIEWLNADMRHLHMEQPVDVAINVFDGIDCLLSNDDLIAHFHSIANCLTEGGLYFIDVTHPRLTSFNYYEPFSYSGERDGIRVEIQWKGNPERIDPITHIASTEVEMKIQHNGHVETLIDIAQERIIDAQEIMLLAHHTGKLKPIQWYGDYRLDQPFDHSTNSTRMIAVLQKI